MIHTISSVNLHLDQGHNLIGQLLVATTHLKKNGTIYLEVINTVIKGRSRIFGLYEVKYRSHYCIMKTLAYYYRCISGVWIKINDYSLLEHKG